MNNLTDVEIKRIRRRVISWGRKNYQNYPWRSDSSAWLTFVAEFFLQRTRAEQVEEVYREFRSVFPTPLSVATANFQDVFRVMGRLGLVFRIRYLMDIAQAVVYNGGTLPETMEKLTSFRGVGGYTAGAWLSLHRNKRAILVDSNVARWLSRMTGNTYNRDPRSVPWVEDIANRLTPVRSFRDYNYAVLDLTIQVCRPRKPKCEHCPVRVDCLYGNSLQLKR